MAAVPDAAQVAAMLARILDLEGVNANLNVQGLAVQGQLAVAQENLDAARARNVSKPKIPSPSVFSGRTGAAVDEWIEEMKKQFTFYPDYFDGDEAKISHALMYVAPTVTAWYRTCSEEHRVAGTPIVTWAGFVVVLLERYQPVSASMTARANLDRLTQTGNVAGYTSIFYSNMNYIKDMGAADQVHQYTRGLKQALRFEVVKQKPRTLTEAANIAITAEAMITTSSNSSSSSSNFTYRPSRSGYSGAGAGSAAPMDVNLLGQEPVDGTVHERTDPNADSSSREELLSMVRNLQTQMQSRQSLNAMFGGQDHRARDGTSSGTKVPGISKEDYERCRRENVCLRCKEPGHIASKCSKPVRLNW